MIVDRHLSLPPEKLCWAVLNAPGWSRHGALPPGLRAALTDELPMSEPLHAVGVPLRDSTILVCAATVASIRALDGDTLTLTPSTLPAFAASLPGAPDPAALNLLVGEFEPHAYRRVRWRGHAMAAATVLLCAALVALGLGRRSNAWRAEATQARNAESALLRTALPEGEDPTIALANLRRAAAAAARPSSTPDAATDLAAVLAGWPVSASCVTHSIAVGSDGASVSVALDNDPAEFLRALRPPPGWTLDEPRLNAAGDSTRVSLRLRRSFAAEGAAP